MADEAENHTLAILREIRADIADIKGDIAEMKGDIVDLRTRVDGDTIILNIVAGYVRDHDARIEALKNTSYCVIAARPGGASFAPTSNWRA